MTEAEELELLELEEELAGKQQPSDPFAPTPLPEQPLPEWAGAIADGNVATGLAQQYFQEPQSVKLPFVGGVDLPSPEAKLESIGRGASFGTLPMLQAGFESATPPREPGEGFMAYLGRAANSAAAAPVKMAISAASRLTGGQGVPEIESKRQQWQQRGDRLEEENPVSSAALQALGMAPMAMAGGAATGLGRIAAEAGGQALASSVGRGEGPGDAAQRAAIDVGTTGALGGLLKLTGMAGKAAGNAVAKSDWLKNFATERGGGALGVERGTFKKMVDSGLGMDGKLKPEDYEKVIEDAYRAGVIKAGDTKIDVANKFKEWLGRTGRGVDKSARIIEDKLGEAGKQDITTLGTLADRVEGLAGPERMFNKSSIFSEPYSRTALSEGQGIRKDMEAVLEPVREASAGREAARSAYKGMAPVPGEMAPIEVPTDIPATFSDVLARKRQLNAANIEAMTKRRPDGTVAALGDTYGIYSDELKKAAEGVGRAPQWHAANKAYAQRAAFAPAAQNSLAAMAGNNPISLNSSILSAGISSLPGKALGYIGGTLTRNRGAATAGAFARKASIAGRSGRFGEFADEAMGAFGNVATPVRREAGMLENYLQNDTAQKPMTDEEREQIAGPSFVNKNGGGGK